MTLLLRGWTVAGSPSSRRAWIEIPRLCQGPQRGPRSPSSRRAWIEIGSASAPRWGARSPSSRRAWIEIAGDLFQLPRLVVALLAEGVDRNSDYTAALNDCAGVALLAEGVDRNWTSFLTGRRPHESPSSRRAWIEITMLSSGAAGRRVALLAEGVDRNDLRRVFVRVAPGRPPRGGRG
mgnify:CR=1 FL=1